MILQPAGADQRAVPERAAPGGGEQRAAAGVGHLLRRAATAPAPGAAAGAGGPGGRPPSVQGVHVEGVQDLRVPDQARRQQALLLRDHGDRGDELVASRADTPAARFIGVCVGPNVCVSYSFLSIEIKSGWYWSVRHFFVENVGTRCLSAYRPGKKSLV